jgi:hypothetical protein
MIPVLRSLATGGRPVKPASAPTGPPLMRLWAAQLTGTPAKFAPHEVYCIPPTKRDAPPSGETRNGFSDPGTEGQYQAARSQTENSQTRGAAEGKPG